MSNLGIATDMANPHFAGASNPDAVLNVYFFDKEHPNEFLSQKEQRPVKEMRTYIHIETPGNATSIIETFAYEHHKQRFPLQWARYQNAKDGDETPQIGTMLSDWPILNAAQATELKHFKFYTVEQVANASDAQIMAIGMCAGMAPHAFREKARVFLKTAQDQSVVHAQSEELKAEREKREALEAQMLEMKAQLEALTAKKKPGRPAKVVNE